jgi:hypothetical protein
MQELFASYLAQKKECSIPLIGKFEIKTQAAELDIANKQILPPADEIIFSEGADYLADDLTNYISFSKNLSLHEAEEKIHHWCLHSKSKLDFGEEIIFDSIGSLQKNEAGIIFFQRKNGVKFFENISAERVVHKNAEHAVLVGDRETTSSAMNEYYRDVPLMLRKSSWKLWAIILFILSLIIIGIYFYSHKLSITSIGNQSSFAVQDQPASYSILQ